MNWRTTSLDELLAGIWQSLGEATGAMDHPFRTAGLATASEMGPGVRMVILRKAEEASRTLTCYTDGRAAKIRHIHRNPEVQWLFHNPPLRMQLRASGSTVVHQGNKIARSGWEQLPAANRLNYASRLTPGHTLANPDDAIPPDFRGRDIPPGELDFAFENFAVISTCVDHFDWLVLGSDGHRRAGFTWVGGRFEGQWLVP